MESFKIENLSFKYPEKQKKALDNINLTINQGEFVLLFGESGCGKTTLLRMLKTALSPYGDISGSIFFNEKPLKEYNAKEQASQIGFVMQSCENQIVTDKVWHELAFGLESLGMKQSEIRTRVSEMASFFGIQNWFHKNTTELSGGQKQLLNLASVMVMNPSVLLLDEPTSQLDPIAADEFLKTLKKINQELGTTVILSEHRIEDAFELADKVIVMEEGKLLADALPEEIGLILKNAMHPMYKALPSVIRVHSQVQNSLPCPLTVRDGRKWLEDFSKENTLNPDAIKKDSFKDNKNIVIEMKDVWFRYEKNSPDIVKDFSLTVNCGELFCLLGGNGTGKTTALSLISGLYTPYRGEVLIKNQKLSELNNLYDGLLGVLPQNPQTMFLKKTVYLDLMEILSEKDFTEEEKEEKIKNISALCKLESLLNSHPYDLSGGEQQRAAIAKILLKEPEILILDEPTKGMDAPFKEEFADILMSLKESGVTILMVSHDIEFAAEYADRCALMFDGNLTSVDTPREFFKGKNFYTTSANRMARTKLPDAILADDIISACGGELIKREHNIKKVQHSKIQEPAKTKEEPQKLSLKRIILGSIFTLFFLLISMLFVTDNGIVTKLTLPVIQIFQVLSIAFAFCCFFPQKKIGTAITTTAIQNKKLTKRTLMATFLILLFIPLTIYFGIYYLGDRKYYFISLLIILETMLPFGMVFESRKPQARELIVISVLCAIAVMGRAVFFTLPQFKPVIALVIISGLCFGGETGFLVGSVTGFVSNFFYGQGPWTPWQMFAFGIIGFLAGILFKKGLISKTKASLCIFGFIATLVIYGGIVNPASVIMTQNKITKSMLMAAYASGLPFDFIHALATAFFLWFISEPMIDKLERIKIKYGLIEK